MITPVECIAGVAILIVGICIGALLTVPFMDKLGTWKTQRALRKEERRRREANIDMLPRQFAEITFRLDAIKAELSILQSYPVRRRINKS